MTTRTHLLDVDLCTPDPTRAISLDAAATVSGVLKALADPLRLRMLSAIATDPRGETCVCDFSVLSDVSQPTISHHLKVLKETGLLLSERRGTWVWYRIDPARSGAITALLDNLAPATLSDPTPRSDSLSSKELRGLDARVTHLADELVEQYPMLSGDLVITIVRESYASLSRAAKVTNMLIPLTERFSRQRLTDMSRDRSNGVPQVLFVCVQNAGRSQLAAALLNQRSGGTVVARSAGSTPASDVHPKVRSLLAQVEGNETAETAFPKPLTDDAVRAADVVVTMGCGDVCPIIPGVHYEDWAVADPALASDAGVAAIRDDITARIDVLLAAQPLKETVMTTPKPSVLFVCVHNAGRSQMAAGFLRDIAGDKVDVRSAGSLPADRINPVAVEAMNEVGIDITAEQPKVLTTDAVQASDVVITMGCGDACPFFPGKRYEDWKLDDPAGQGIEAVRPIRDDIKQRIEALIASLDVTGRP